MWEVWREQLVEMWRQSLIQKQNKQNHVALLFQLLFLLLIAMIGLCLAQLLALLFQLQLWYLLLWSRLFQSLLILHLFQELLLPLLGRRLH